MFKFINISELVSYLFDEENLSRKAVTIMQALLEARSPRLSQIAEKMPGLPATNYKTIQRFLAKVDLKAILLRLFQEQAEYVIGDPTEMERPQAKKTAYVGQLSDGQTLGYWLLVLATPFRGRAIPFHFITYSSKTIGSQATSRNLEHFRAFSEVKALLGERPLVLDREFSYLELLENLVVEQVHFVIRLKVGLPQVTLIDGQGQPIKLRAQPGKQVIYRQLLYKGLVKVNVIGVWQEGFQTPLWVMSDLEPERALEIYFKRMKIEESFRDCKSLLGVEQVMNKQQSKMEQMIALTLLAYVVALFFGEALRDVTFGSVSPKDISHAQLLLPPQKLPERSKWRLYSGLFVLLKMQPRLPPKTLRLLQRPVASAFACLVLGDVRSFV
jgi:hypothetical protein